MKRSYRKTIRRLTKRIKNQENLKRVYKLAVYLWMNEGKESINDPKEPKRSPPESGHDAATDGG